MVGEFSQYWFDLTYNRNFLHYNLYLQACFFQVESVSNCGVLINLMWSIKCPCLLLHQCDSSQHLNTWNNSIHIISEGTVQNPLFNIIVTLTLRYEFVELCNPEVILGLYKIYGSRDLVLYSFTLKINVLNKLSITTSLSEKEILNLVIKLKISHFLLYVTPQRVQAST